jgi:hypothetical protein
MTTTEPAPPASSQETPPWLQGLHPAYRLALRWVFIAVAAFVAFQDTLTSVIETVQRGGINGFIIVVPAACVLAAVGVGLRQRTELPIHDRETDVIVGTMGLVLSALLHAVLLDRYTQYFHLLRLDLVALWLFLLSSSIVLFGLRPVYRFRWVWVLLLAVFPLPYHIAVILLGGSRTAAGGVTLVIAALATGIAVGRTARRGVLGAVAAWAVGLLILGSMALLVPQAPLLAFQTIPAITSIVLVGGTLYARRHRGGPLFALERKVEPLASSQVWAGLPLVMVMAIALSFKGLPGAGLTPPSDLDRIDFGAPLLAPPGWHVSDTEEFTWVSKVYGPDARLIRQKFVADAGNPLWDKFARPRAIVVDSVTTSRPFAFHTYPAKVLYHVTTIRQSAPRQVDLGPGVSGTLVNVINDDSLITWNALDWIWENNEEAQQITAFAVDNHEPEALFPSPTGALLPTLDTLFTVLLRGNAAVTDDAPAFKDADMLVEFSRGVVATTLEQRPTT